MPQNRRFGHRLGLSFAATILVCGMAILLERLVPLSNIKGPHDEMPSASAGGSARDDATSHQEAPVTTAIGHDGTTPAAHAHHDGSQEAVTQFTMVKLHSHLQSMEHVLVPDKDAWQSESFAVAVDAQLKRLGQLLARPATVDQKQLIALIDANFACGPLRPRLTDVFSDAAMVVRRPAPVHSPSLAHDYHGARGLASALQQMLKPVEGCPKITSFFKVVDVKLHRSRAECVVQVELVGRDDRRTVGQDAVWNCGWTLPPRGKPQLTRIDLQHFEEVEGGGPHGTWFSDCTEAVLGHNESFHAQLRHGFNHWVRRIEKVHYIDNNKSCGITVGDVNSDGLDDVFLCQPGGLPNRLFVQNQDGTATDRTERAGVEALDHTSSALLVDLDNDGDQDLVMAIPLHLALLQNNGDGTFRPRATLRASDRDVESLSAVDFDDDGRLDLYLCTDFADSGARPEVGPRFVFHDANDGGANVLWRNQITGDRWQFVDVTKAVGLDRNNRRHSMAASWEDYDNDGDQDLYVANDYGKNFLYRNDGGRFVEVAEQAGVIDSGAGMSVSWGDVNGDGWMDLYVGNMFSSAGKRITSKSQFQPHSAQDVRAIYRRFAKGNSLFENRGDGTFREIGNEAGAEHARWAWSSLLADLNNDGRQDVLVANGFITGQDAEDL